MLKLRQARVVSVQPDAIRASRGENEPGTRTAPREQRLVVELTGGSRQGEQRSAVADVSLVGRAHAHGGSSLFTEGRA